MQQRADFLCEYCHSPEFLSTAPLTIDPILHSLWVLLTAGMRHDCEKQIIKICASYDIKNNAERAIVVNVQLVELIKQLIQALPPEEQNWLKAQLQDSDRPSPKIVDLNSFNGTIQLQQDPLEFQRQVRDEWA